MLPRFLYCNARTAGNQRLQRRAVNPYDAIAVDADDPKPHLQTGWLSIRTASRCLVCMAIGGVFHFLIREYYPANIDRTKWLAAFALLALRNGFIGASIGILIRHGWLGLIVGVVAPPIVFLAIYGVPC